MPQSALSAGIEIELLIATLPIGQPHPNPSETRTVVFPRVPGAVSHPEENPASIFASRAEAMDDVSHHVTQTLIAAGVRVTVPQDKDEHQDITCWDIDRDASIQAPPMNHGYLSVGIEIRSPAFFVTADSLRELGFVVGVLTSKYVVSVNESCGLHCHVGNGLESFHFNTLRQLMAFLFAFEPQINTLHPPHRFNSHWAQSLRCSSVWSRDFERDNGRLPRPLEGVEHFLKSRSWQKMLQDRNAAAAGRPAYRFSGLATFVEGRDNLGANLTVEFRQHAGTVDGEAIQNWVRTVVGIVSFIVDTDLRELNKLLSVVAHETFDDKSGATVEPVLAETNFTIIDLLRHMKLDIPAAYYQRRGLYIIRNSGNGEALTNVNRGLQVTNPDDDEEVADSFGASLDPAVQRRLREEMESQRRAFYQQGNNQQLIESLQYNPYNPYIPYDPPRMQSPKPRPSNFLGNSWIRKPNGSRASLSNTNAVEQGSDSSEEFPMRRHVFTEPGSSNQESAPLLSPDALVNQILDRLASNPTINRFLDDEMDDISLLSLPSDANTAAAAESDEQGDEQAHDNPEAFYRTALQ